MDRLDAMSVILAVSETGGLSAASRRLGMPVPTVSRKVADLESYLRAELFRRSSRRLVLTEAGRDYVEACRRILEQVDDAERQASGEYSSPKGDLAVTSPWGLGHTHMLPLTLAFMQTHPAVNVRLLLTDRVVDVMDEGIDVAVRVGSLAESGMIATRIGSIRIVVCASPGYLARKQRPRILDDIADHDCIAINGSASPNVWRFVENGRERTIPLRSRLVVNTSEAAVLAAISGGGLTQVMSYKMAAARSDGALIRRPWSLRNPHAAWRSSVVAQRRGAGTRKSSLERMRGVRQKPAKPLGCDTARGRRP